MGVTIRYRGRLADLDKINNLCDELIQVSEKMQWPHTRFDEDWSKLSDARLVHDERAARIEGHIGLKGISLRPHPECESVTFLFDWNGNLGDPMSVVLVHEGSLKAEEVWINVKTQFAGPEIHMWVVGLLKYVQAYYIPGLEVCDEGQYWETGNFDVLKKKMNFLKQKMAEVCGELSRITGNHLERLSPADIATMIEGLLHARFDDRDGQ